MLLNLNVDRSVSGKKRSREDEPVTHRKISSWGLKLQIKWFACHIARTDTRAIVKSLRAAYPDWSIVSEPHWYRESGGP